MDEGTLMKREDRWTRFFPTLFLNFPEWHPSPEVTKSERQGVPAPALDIIKIYCMSAKRAKITRKGLCHRRALFWKVCGGNEWKTLQWVHFVVLHLSSSDAALFV